MRNVRHLNHCDYVIRLKTKKSQVVVLSNCNMILERTWHKLADDFELRLHAKFNTLSMNGIQISGELLNHGKAVSSLITGFNVYAVSETDWSETFIGTALAILTGGNFYSAYMSQSTLGSNELSGREVYRIECTAYRLRKSFKKYVYFNHLGCFDSINRLRQYADQINILKVDE